MTAGLRVLIVEDDEFAAEILCDFIEQQSMVPVGPVPTVGDALQVLDAVSVDAALLNIRLRGEYVFPVCEVLWALRKPFAFVSGSLSDVPDKFKNVPKLDKPYDTRELATLLKSFGDAEPA